MRRLTCSGSRPIPGRRGPPPYVGASFAKTFVVASRPGEPALTRCSLSELRRRVADAAEGHEEERPATATLRVRHRGHSELTVTAGILHDAVENTSPKISEVADQVSPDVAALVEALTENAAIDQFEARKADLRERIAQSGPEATAVYAADKVSKVRALRALLTAGARSGIDEVTAHQKFDHYVESLHMLEAHPRRTAGPSLAVRAGDAPRPTAGRRPARIVKFWLRLRPSRHGEARTDVSFLRLPFALSDVRRPSALPPSALPPSRITQTA